MSGILRLESLTKGNTLKQGDKTPLKYRLFDADGEKLNIAGKSAQVRLVYPDFLTIGYEKDGLTVAQDDTVTFTIDSVIPARVYHVEIIVDDKFVFPSRSDEAKFTVDKSSLGTETNIIEIIGVDAVVRKAVDLINEDPNLIIDEDKLVTDIISNTGIGSIEEYYQQFNDVITELSEDKDYHSLPEIAGARGGHDTLGQRLDETTAQLEQKAEEDEVFLKEHGIDINDFNEQTRQTFLEAQGIDVNYVLGLGNVKPENTSFFDIGKNMFDKTNVVLGKYVNRTNGNLADGTNYNATDYIAVLPNTTYTGSVFYHGAIYDGDKNYISAVPSRSFETPANGHFIRMSLKPEDMDTFQIEKGTSSTSYEPFRQTIEPNSIPDLEDGSITVNKTDFIKIGKNLFDKSTATKGYYVNNVSGKLSANDSYYASDFIEIEGDTKYIEPGRYYKAFYDKDKVRIGGLPIGHEVPFTTPINARFLRTTVPKDGIDFWQLEQNTIRTSYEPSGYFVDKNIYSSSEAAEFPNQFIGITLPETIPAVVGHEVNIYFENIVRVDNIENYQVDVVCSKGKHQTERWTFVPNAADVGEHSLTIEIYKEFKLITTKTTKIKVAPKTSNSGTNPNVLIIGDSTTANGYTASELNTLLTNDVMGVNLIGTQGTAPALHEGRSGWTTNTFYNSTDSPFVFDGAFNFAQYLDTNGLTTPDVVIINLGINDVFAATSDEEVLNIAENMVSQYDSMINNIRNVNPETIFGVCVTIPSGNQDAFSDYGSGQTSWRYKLNNRLLAKHINDYMENKATNVHLIPINVCIDTVNNMAFDEETTINSRTEKTIKRQRNGVHPGVAGYEQIADMDFYWLKNLVIP